MKEPLKQRIWTLGAAVIAVSNVPASAQGGNGVSLADRAPKPHPERRINYMAWIAQQAPAASRMNAASTYLRGVAELKPVPDPRALEASAKGPWQNRPAVADWLIDNTAYIDIFTSATQFDACYLGLRPTTPNDAKPHWQDALNFTVVPGLGSFDVVSQALLAQGWGGWDGRDADWLIDNVVTNLKTVHHLEGELSLVARLTALRIAERSHSAMIRAIALVDHPISPFGPLAEGLDESDPPLADLASAYDFQQLTAWDILQRVYQTGGSPGEWRVHPSAKHAYDQLATLIPEGMPEWDEVKPTLEASGFDASLEAVNAYFDRLRSWNREPYHEAATSTAQVIAAGESMPNLLMRVFVRGLTGPRATQVRASTLQRGAHLLLHIIDFKERNKRYPDSLGDLDEAAASWNQDPYSGESFIYARTRESFVLYSVGADNKDDASRSYLPGTTKGDLVIWPQR